jgi:hypothetical protein
VGALECLVNAFLGFLLHAPRGPFYSPKAARSRWRPTRKAKVAFCRVVHRTATVHVRCVISFLFWRRRPLQIRGSWRTGHCPVHTGQSGAPCRLLTQATRRPRIARPTIALAAVGSPDSPVHHQTVWWIIVVRRQTFPRVACSPEAGLAHRTLSGAPPNSPVWQTELDFGCTQPSLLQFFVFLFLALRHNMFVLKTIY